ncbi:unnamed protein product [Adineta ricciae]|uniref:Uncharacterized protein n=1 Tax=Adineta ricciae TaxID=249248 RepID=A0A815LZK2_ADIRI|nr:unnamed protein product [Adineta ricciae]
MRHTGGFYCDEWDNAFWQTSSRLNILRIFQFITAFRGPLSVVLYFTILLRHNSASIIVDITTHFQTKTKLVISKGLRSSVTQHLGKLLDY